MGNQQLILLVLGTIVVAIAIAVGISQFRAMHEEAIGDQMQEVLLDLVAEAKMHLEKPKTLGGGGGTFEGFKLPGKLPSIEGVTFVLNGVQGTSSLIILGAHSASGIISVIVSQGSSGLTIQWTGTGEYASRRTSPTPL